MNKSKIGKWISEPMRLFNAAQVCMYFRDHQNAPWYLTMSVFMATKTATHLII